MIRLASCYLLGALLIGALSACFGVDPFIGVVCIIFAPWFLTVLGRCAWFQSLPNLQRFWNTRLSLFHMAFDFFIRLAFMFLEIEVFLLVFGSKFALGSFALAALVIGFAALPEGFSHDYCWGMAMGCAWFTFCGLKAEAVYGIVLPTWLLLSEK